MGTAEIWSEREKKNARRKSMPIVTAADLPQAFLGQAPGPNSRVSMEAMSDPEK